MNNMGKKALERLDEAFIEDVLEMSDHEILSEFVERGGDISKNVEETSALFRTAILLANKERMVAAKAALARGGGSNVAKAPINMAEARRRLCALLDRAKDEGLTLAARKESELSDDDVLSMLADYDDLQATRDSKGDDGDR